MFQLQLKWYKQGEWENTVFKPMDKMLALKWLANYNQLWSHIHCYRIIEVAN